VPRPEEMLFPTRPEHVEDRRKERHQRKLLDEFFDYPTLLAIGRCINRGLFLSLDSPISTGKEGGVFRATSVDGFRAVKVHRINNTVFRRLPPHVVEELRRETSSRNFSRMVFAWTRREHTILKRLADASVRVPIPLGVVRNVLVMSFVGENGEAAPRLHDSLVEDPQGMLDDLTTQLKRMVTGAKLVHGDMSPYNVLVDREQAVLIDVGQAISSAHPQAEALLTRDAANFARYFGRLGLEITPQQFFEKAGGGELGGRAG
jgi:RIO kinase 1